MNKETLRMQMLAGLITENEYKNLMESMNIDQLFNEWKLGELEVGNDGVDVEKWELLDDEDKRVFNSYINLVNNYPTIDHDDLAALNSIALFGGTGLKYNNYEWNNLKPKDFYSILNVYF